MQWGWSPPQLPARADDSCLVKFDRVGVVPISCGATPTDVHLRECAMQLSATIVQAKPSSATPRDSRASSVSSIAGDAIVLPDFLKEAGKRVGVLGAEFKADCARLDGLQQRLREERCHLAVLGQFKRGKSTLVNAILGAPVLPTAIVPLTSIPTFLHGGEQLAARVVFDNGKKEEQFSGPDAEAMADFLTRYVTESANPHNRLGVRVVEATYPRRCWERAWR